MDTVTMKARDAGQLVGKYIAFEWTDGWEDWPQSGYLHGISSLDATPYVYFYMSHEATLEPGVDPEDLGGVGISPSAETTFLVGAPHV